MSRFLEALVIGTVLAQPLWAEGTFGLGRDALPEEIAAWDIDIRPDGLGLPAGRGDVDKGEEIFVAKCTACHGDFGEAVGRWPQLAGGQGTLASRDPVKTIGSYWPYLSTVYDYVNRAMPFGEAQSLEPDEIYAITAYLLYLNDIVDQDFTLSDQNFTAVQMPNAPHFFDDDRATTELPSFISAGACMSDCKDSVEITMRASLLDVTPDATVVAADPVEDAALVAAGESVFRQCKACHQIGAGAVNRTGPHLNGIMGRTIGSVDGFRYSNAFMDAAAVREIWTEDRLAEFLANPRMAMDGTRMSFRGIRDDADMVALLAYLSSVSE